MKALDPKEIIELIRKNDNAPQWVHDAREYSKTLKALVTGEGYEEELIKIEHIESSDKQKVRKKYTFSIKDLFERLFVPLDNVWTSTGGSTIYKEDNDVKVSNITNAISEVKGGLSIKDWNERYWMPTYHTDPSGVTFLEYNIEKDIEPHPVYVSIDNIRNYKANGINVDWIIFEPKTHNENGNTIKEYRFVDSEGDYTIIQNGNTYTISDNSFKHPFGVCPALINSDIVNPNNNYRLSDIDGVLELTKEYLRDKSIKTIFKFLQGFPAFWRYVSHCKKCGGTGRNGTEKCDACDGHGIVRRRDVSDSIDIVAPKEGENILAPNIAGWLTPPLDIWGRYDTELEILEKAIKLTQWGTVLELDKSNTATGRVIDAQPMIQKLNKYSRPAEVREQKLINMIANYLDPLKDKKESIVSVSYGRNYAIIPSDALLDIYEKSKEKGDNIIIREKSYEEYLLSKYKSDPVGLAFAQLKTSVAPLPHYTLEEVNLYFGAKAARKKMMFGEWWNNEIIGNRQVAELKNSYKEWFKNIEMEFSKENLNNNNNE